MKNATPTAPLFEMFSIEQLASLIPYEQSYLEELSSGRQPIRPRFRSVVSRILGRSEAELFGGGADGGDASVNDEPQFSNREASS